MFLLESALIARDAAGDNRRDEGVTSVELDDYRRSTDHFRHCPGKPIDPEWNRAHEACQTALGSARDFGPWNTRTNSAWVVCLHRAGVVDRDTARKLLLAIDRVFKEDMPGAGLERHIVAALDGDEDLGSVINYGRTLQEPMSRLALRARTLEVLDTVHAFLASVLDVAEANVDTIMAGHTHFSHAQPITFAHYLLAVFDATQRGEEQLALAYKHTNRNSGGCGSTSGTVWTVDRRLMTELLGFDDLVETTYDCEASHDHALSLIFAASNLALLVSRVAMDLEIWTTEEFDLFDVDAAYRGQSSFMPHKAHPGSRLERTRMPAAEVLGDAFKAVCLTSSEPLGDVLTALQVPLGPTPHALAYLELCLRNLAGFLTHITPKRDRMLRIAREGFSCSTEIVVHMVRELGYGGRRAHRITSTFVRMAREQGVTADRTTGEMLDAAAEYVGERPPHIDTDTLRLLLDPVEFIRTHVNTGGVAPEEARRMLAKRRRLLDDLRSAQEDRKRRVREGEERLRSEVDRIVNGDG